MKPKKVIKFLRCELSGEEHRQSALSLARANEAMSQIEEEKKVANSQFAERLAVAKAAIGKNSRIISNGYEMRNVECEVMYHSAVETLADGAKVIKDMPQQKVTRRMDIDHAGLLERQAPDALTGSISKFYPAAAIVAVEAMSEAELQESFDFDQQTSGQEPAPNSTALPLCAACKTESVGKEGDVCGSCQADTKVNGKAKKAGKGPRASAERAGKVVTTAADQAQDEPF